jgi:hypothetical protein
MVHMVGSGLFLRNEFVIRYGQEKATSGKMKDTKVSHYTWCPPCALFRFLVDKTHGLGVSALRTGARVVQNVHQLVACLRD